ncbi:FKBP-type peptidyl-prolyl cis-trans isomerase N-terminal domain-containing protein [Kosakonia sp. R1.Fl]|uniref:FKBP-type peptidyl-prolyl cis-trans isomerase N-terminal domain-containing protein n=1 Tax=Kosakonia sp. R1.Fl TaxID=2928706 RepID=UPI00201E2CF8|nr:FKBP-type peptidyl-prolyl cis-trans isomerase N-terminal domain-containing protein [Kosakonia sp. R1.Fl]MCL6744295.1 FKBP-type peptidyl-prolyl cis-trans isomerase [Kosakonia sp. R1.Fl]
MRKLFYSSAVLLSAISSSATSAEPASLLDRLNEEHIISAEPQSPFTADHSSAGSVATSSPQSAVKQQTAPKKASSEQEIRLLKRKLAELRRETETLRKKQTAATPIQPKNNAGDDNKQPSPIISSENKLLQQQLQASEKQLAAANNKREEANSNLDAAAKKMSEQALSITTLKDALQQGSEEKIQAEQQLAEAKKQGAELSAKLQQAATKIAEQEKQLAEANKKRDDVTSQLAAATKQTAGQTSQLAALEATLKQRSEEKSQAEQQLAEAKNQGAELSAKLQQAATKTAEQEKQLAEANKKRDEITSQLAAATKQAADQQSQLAGANKKRDEITDQLTAATKQTADQASHIAALEAKLKQSSEEKAQMEQQLAAVKSAPAAAENGAGKANSPAFSLAADKSELARVNYAWGVWFAAKVQLESETLKDIGQQFMPQAFLQGLQDKFAGSLQMPNADLEKVLTTLNKQVDDARQREITRNKKQGQQLLADAAKLKGAVRADNGVVYLVEKRGPGAAIGDTDVIRFKVDEKVSSGQVLAQNEVNTARVSELPMVMRAGVKKLVVGGRVKIYVPTELAYGEEGIPGAVPPGVTSVMTLEVLGIEK